MPAKYIRPTTEGSADSALANDPSKLFNTKLTELKRQIYNAGIMEIERTEADDEHIKGKAGCVTELSL